MKRIFLHLILILWIGLICSVSSFSNEDIKLLQNFYEVVFADQNFRSNIEKLEKNIIANKYVKMIINFLNSDKKRPISLPVNKNENN